jgi:hypothetical protein
MIFHQYFLQCLSQLSYLIGDVGRPDLLSASATIFATTANGV